MSLRSLIRGLVFGLVLAMINAGGVHAQSLQSIPFSYSSQASTNSTLVSGAGQNILKWIVVGNSNASTINYLKLYNKATAPTCGTDTPVLRIMLPGTSTGGGVTALNFDDTRFTLGIGFCLTGAAADNDTTAAATGILINLGYLGQ